jgi:L-fucose isomerase-like protein
MKPLQIAFAPLARTTFDIPLAAEVTDTARNTLQSAGYTLLQAEDLITDISAGRAFADSIQDSQPDLLLIFQATFADSTMALALVEAVDAPVFLWAIPEDHTGGRLRLNSFCGINLAGHALTRAGIKYDFLFAPANDAQVLARIEPIAKAGRARNVLRSSRLGRMGKNPDGFETCTLDEARIEALFGLEVVQFGLEQDVFPAARVPDANRVDEIYTDLNQQVEGLADMDKAATRKTLGVYATLEEMAKEQELGGFAVRCWPEFFTELGCAACGAMSMLSDGLIPCSCEADVNGTITQMMLQSISGEPAFGTDLVSIDEERDAVVIWHCGLAPLSMADPERPKGVTIHSNRKLPLLFEFTLKPGRVTIARLTESSGDYRLVVGSGVVVRGPKSFSGTSGLIHFDSPARDVLETILAEGLEHHISLTYGDHVPALLAFAKLMKLPIVRLNEM